MKLRIESSVVRGLIVAAAPVLGLVAAGCGEDFESCESTRTCAPGGKGGAAGSAGAGGSAGTSGGGGSSGASGGVGGTNGKGGAASGSGGAAGDDGAAGDGGDAGDRGDAGRAGESGEGGDSGDSGAGGSAGRGGADGSGGTSGAGGSGGTSGIGGTSGSGGLSGASGSGGSSGSSGNAGNGGGGGTVTPPNPCQGVTCVNGECADVGGVGVCECSTGFVGERCELPTFEWIELSAGQSPSEQVVLSDNGTVFGCCGSNNTWFRWTHEAGSSSFGSSDASRIGDASRDASFVVGALLRTPTAFRWTAASGFVNLGVLPGGDANSTSYANGVSANGSVVVGVSDREPFRWTSGTGMVKLAMPDGLPTNARGQALAVSDDGSIVGGLLSASSTTTILRWTAGALERIEPSRSVDPSGFGMSADGEVIGGTSSFAGVPEAFRWTRSGGIVSLGKPSECSRTEFYSLSDDGRMVAVMCYITVGSSYRTASYLWSLDSGFRRVEDVLQNIGADIADAGTIYASRLSFDGSTILGSAWASGAFSPTRLWIARLPPARN